MIKTKREEKHSSYLLLNKCLGWDGGDDGEKKEEQLGIDKSKTDL